MNAVAQAADTEVGRVESDTPELHLGAIVGMYKRFVINLLCF